MMVMMGDTARETRLPIPEEGCSPKASAEPRRSEAWLLAERVKELNCLYRISRLFERDGEPLDKTLTGVVRLLPPAWQYDEVAEARIELHGRIYSTEGFRETPWEQSCPIVVLGETAGRVTVCYLEERPEGDEGPFLHEERSLLNAVSQRLGGLIEREQAREQLVRYQENLRSLAAQLAVGEQQERRRIAELLHDRVGQTLALMSLKLAQARSLAPHPELDAILADAQEIAGRLTAETRSLTFELCPPILYELGFTHAVDWLAEQFEEQCGLDVELVVEGDFDPESEQLRTTLFQAVRELLTNVVKHAEARRATIRLAERGPSLLVSVEDDGLGIESADLATRMSPHDGFGLFNIRERLMYLGGALRAERRPGGGTLVTLEAPRDA
jgi:two-component system, NarL family, sensor kinase